MPEHLLVSPLAERILGLGEVKFPPDDWSDDQYDNAARIAGGEDNVHTLTPESCLCAGEKQKLEERAGQPALDTAADKAQAQALAQMAVNLAELAAKTASFVTKRNPVGLFFSTLFEASPAL
jgi:hypothetical protein